MIKRKAIIVMVSATIVLACLSVVGIYLFLAAPGFHDAVTDITEESFQTDAERREFLDSGTPFSIPPGITDIRIKYISWLDWKLDASFTLPPGEEEAFLTQLRGLDPDGTAPFTVKGEHSVGAVTVTGRSVRMQFSNSSPE